MTWVVRRVALVTGASSGIGAACARRLAGDGVGLLLHARANAEGLAAVAEQARSAGVEVATALADLAEAGAARALVATALARFGRLDGLVSNAGFAARAAPGTFDRAALDRAFAAQAGAFGELVEAARRSLAQSDAGAVVAVSSFVAHRFREAARFVPSAAAKAGLEALVKAAAADLAPAGVTVNAVAPGYVRKDPGRGSAMSAEEWAEVGRRVPLGRVATPEDVAGVIVFLLGPDARYVTGQVLHADGGLGL